MTSRHPDRPHHDAVERFIAGEDRLSALLREVPHFEPPANLATAVAAAARAVQARMAAEAERDAVRRSAPPPTFAAPPTLSDSVLREAARLQAAQAARRDVVFEQLLQGKPADDVLGAPVSAPTAAWLRTHAAQHRDETASKAVAAPARRARVVSRWWRSLGVAATAFAVAGLATKIVLSQLDDGTPTTASLSSNVVIADLAAPAAPAEPALASAPALAGAPSTGPAHEARTEAAPPASAPARAAPPDEPVRRPTRPSPSARKAQDSSPSPSPSTPPAAAAESTSPAPAAPAAPAILAAPPPTASMQAQADAAPAPAPQAGAAAAQAPAVGTEARARRTPQSAFMAAPAPAPTESAAASTTTMQEAAPQAQKSATVTLEDDPASVAMQWRPGKGLHVWSAEPDNAAVRDWVARLWAAMPADARPVAPYGIQRDDALARGQLRIEQRAARADAR